MTPRHAFAAAVALSAALASATPLRAQSVDTSKPVRLVNLDLAVPDSPAFVMLGLSPEKVVRPGAPRDLATTILNGVDRHGNLQTGLAVDFAPLFLFAGNNLEFAQYRDHKSTQILGRTQVSLATAKGASDSDKSVRAAAGVRSTLWDQGDPRLDAELVKCLDAIVVPAPATALLTQEARSAVGSRAGEGSPPEGRCLSERVRQASMECVEPGGRRGARVSEYDR